jgi:hypothetical protein
MYLEPMDREHFGSIQIIIVVDSASVPDKKLEIGGRTRFDGS